MAIRPAAVDSPPERETLDETQHDERDGGDHAHTAIGRQHTDSHRRQTHHQERAQEHGLAADAVAEMAEDDTAERPGKETDRKGREHRQRGRQLIEFREEQLIEHQWADQPVDEEVVPFDRGADGAGHQNAAPRTRRRLRADVSNGALLEFLKAPDSHVFLPGL
jgi:hypothetical protein